MSLKLAFVFSPKVCHRQYPHIILHLRPLYFAKYIKNQMNIDWISAVAPWRQSKIDLALEKI